MNKSIRNIDKLLFILPVLLWIVFYIQLYHQGEIHIHTDAKIVYIYNNYFLNNIAQGVYPFWNPFTNWGRPDDFVARMVGEFNPFLYIILLLEVIGFNYSMAFFIYSGAYFLLGCWGFYLLARRLLANDWAAYGAFVALLFSNLWFLLTTDYDVILIFVPAVWFFYFLVAFIQSPARVFMVGMAFCLMVLATTYMPFHFLYIAVTLLLLWVLIYIKDLKLSVVSASRFIFMHKILTGVCFLLVGLSMLPSLSWRAASLKSDLMMWWRKWAGGSGGIDMGENFIELSSMANMGNCQYILNNLDDIQAGDFYVPLFVFILVILGAGLRINRQGALLFVLLLMILFISMGQVTPLYSFLYKHVFFIKYFRNLHFFIWAVGAILILFASQQLAVMLECLQEKKHRHYMLWLIIVGHLACLLILVLQSRVVFASYVSVIISFFVFLFIYLDWIKGRWIGVVLFLAIVVQPLQVFNIMIKQAQEHRFAYSKDPYTLAESKPVFSFLRPTLAEEALFKQTLMFGEVKDRSGLLKDNYMGTNASYEFLEHLDSDYLKDYVRRKFVMYPYRPGQDPLYLVLNQTFQSIETNSPSFHVVSFGLNHINFNTNFADQVYLVYNDSYDPHWQATIDGKALTIDKSNLAFKGMHIPAGKHHVELNYKSQMQLFFWALLGIFFLVLIWLVVLSVKYVKARNHEATT